jgi:hypothetical protein
MRPIVILCPSADLSHAMNIHQLIFGGFMLIRAAMIALDLAVAVLVVSIGVAAAGRLRRLNWFNHGRHRSVTR